MAERAVRIGSARRQWTRRTSLTVRILAVNIIALALMAGSLFYLDSYRKQLLDQRFKLAAAEAEILADGLAQTGRDGQQALVRRVSSQQQLRIRLYGPDGALLIDSDRLGPPAFTLVDPAAEPFLLRAARQLDRAMNFVLGAEPVPAYRDPARDSAAAWPELGAARADGATHVAQRAARDETPVINAAARVGVSVYRYGGEEFALIFCGGSFEQAVQFVESLRTTIGNLVLRDTRSGERLSGITVSIGIASRHRGETAEQLLERADTALYRAKASGRNKVCPAA